MVVGQEIRPVQVEEVEGPLPQAIVWLGAVLDDGVGLEGDVGGPTNVMHRPQVPLAEVRLVRRDFVDGEIPGRGFDQGSELRES